MDNRYGAPPPAQGGGTLPLVIGILSLVFCQLLGPVAWMLGSKYERDCRAAGLAPEGTGTAGKILGMVATAILVLSLLAVAAFVVLAVLSDGSGSRSSRDWFDD